MKNLPIVLIVLFIVGWISRIITYKTGGYYHTEVDNVHTVSFQGLDLVTQYINIGSKFPIIALLLCFSEWIKNNNKKFLFSTFFLLFVEILYALPSGSKERIVLPVAILVFLYSLKSKLPVIPVVLATTMVVFFLFPFVGIYRSIYLSGDAISDLQRTYSIYRDMFMHFDMNVFNQILTSIFADRLNFSILVGSVVHQTPEVWNFKYGYTYLLFFISLVPRILWHSKPAIAGMHNEFGRDYGFLHPLDTTTSVGMTWVGEMFINFGWFGVLVGFFYGLGYQIFYSYFLRRGKVTALSAILYAIGLYYLVRGQLFAAAFSGLLKYYLVIIIVLYPFLKKRET